MMNKTLRRESLAVIAGFVVLSVGFLYFVHRPGLKSERSLRAAIERQEQTVQQVPARVAELEAQQREIERRQVYLDSCKELIGREPHLHSVVRTVTSLAAQTGLAVTRLEPLPQQVGASYTAYPHQIRLVGKYRRIVEFLREIEARSRLFTVDELRLETGRATPRGAVEVEAKFVVYSIHSEIADYSENSASLPPLAADRS